MLLNEFYKLFIGNIRYYGVIFISSVGGFWILWGIAYVVFEFKEVELNELFLRLLNFEM